MNFDQMLKTKSKEEIWQRYCNFLDMNLHEFMEIQNQLLMEQIELYANCELGQKIMKGQKPRNPDEFRRIVPLTDYEDYADYLLPKNTKVLPAEPVVWIQTTWEGGKAPIKVAPYSASMIASHREIAFTCIMLATSKRKGHFDLKSNMNFLNGMAPLPYITGLLPYTLQGEYTVNFMPGIDAGNKMSFGERNKVGFKMGIQKGIGLFYGLSSVILRMSENFAEGGTSSNGLNLLSFDIKQLVKFARAKVRTRIEKRPMYPKDVFELKGFVCAGTDTAHFKDKIEEYWGVRPLEIFGGTEATCIGTESWSKSGLIFFPEVCFYEFIPMEEFYKNLQDPTYVPKTYLMNELKPDHYYEIVITTLKGGAFARYRIGDVFKCISLKRKQDGINLPHFEYIDRVDPVIDLAGFTRITEGTINEVIKLSKLNIEDWFACKRYNDQKRPYMALYIELNLKDNSLGLEDPELIKEHLEVYFKYLDDDYKSLKKMLGIEPLEVIVLPNGSIKNYTQSIKHKMARVNPSHFDVTEVLKTSNLKGKA
ncbi:MAG TPA: GH3 auxin-responsive promoter family protein [Erysipelotrichaceae bacterium]|nr:GH3 auxin-responsive promoter family protein [Erysipelotrichaceae bacterium]